MLKAVGKTFLKLIGGTRNERLIRSRLDYVVTKVNPLEPEIRELSDQQLLDRSTGIRAKLADGAKREQIKPEAFALIREASRRGQNHRQFDVQLVAGMVLDEGSIAEEATGEGKTIACYPAIYMAALEGMHTHVITTNDYLVRIGAEFAKPIFEMLGITVGYITVGMDPDERQANYACDVTYGTNSEFGFDYLRDNMKTSVDRQAQGPLDFAIIDEVDSILIDEARTPLIISGPAYGETARYSKADTVARELIKRNRSWDQAKRLVDSLDRELKMMLGEQGKTKGKDGEDIVKKIQSLEEKHEQAEIDLENEVQLYEVEKDRKSAHMTHEGTGVAQDIAGVGSFYVGANMEWPHLMEQALRAHLVYERDKDYVVQHGEVVIVDEFTGRLMEGREWSDGLHQAVCAKERVQVKEENQTLATITLQNFFKLYKKLAGMTGTAITEAPEFVKIYGLDVVCVPTHRPVNRMDHEDRIYADEEAKLRAMVEEIHDESHAGRPVLVGTTSIEKSERLSELLLRTYGTEHQVLNGRVNDADKESEIVKLAGLQRPLKKGSKQMVGAVTIATNMAGRGTDIKLGPGVVLETCKVPSDEEVVAMGLQPDPLYPAGVSKCCINCTQYQDDPSCKKCYKVKLDSEFPMRGRGRCREKVPCGLHIVGTERHEARRIDNQLRGRAGRQGDPGSSRFFLSIRDELLSIFAGEWTLKILSFLGLQGDQMIENKRVSKGIERAQKKVEERNFETRKNLLEYDEVMDYQRHRFYADRQKVLEGRGLEDLVSGMIDDASEAAIGDYLDAGYRKQCIVEWAQKNLQLPVRPDQIRVTGPDGLDDLIRSLKSRAKDEAAGVIAITLGEYMDDDIPEKQWDLKGLSSWAMSRFGVNISQNQLRKMRPEEVDVQLNEAAAIRIDELDLSAVAPYLAVDFPVRSIAAWVQNKFGIELSVDDLGGPTASPKDVKSVILNRVDELYKQREIEYPAEYAIEMTVGRSGPDNVYAIGQLVDWANHKYDADLKPEDFQGVKTSEIYERLVQLSKDWAGDERLEACVRSAVGSDPDVGAAIELAKTRFDTELDESDFNGDIPGRLKQVGQQFLRREMTELERYVLLQIYDQSWKDHLLNMDHLKGGVGLRSFAEQDPRVVYKREGAREFREMLANVQDKVTDMIFKVSLSAGQEQVSNVYDISDTVHEQLSGYDHLTQGMDPQAAQSTPARPVTITRDIPKVGRNDPCPCGSGKKYKKCCGQPA
ncbi:MAG: preprotein translocase subunit SecA [Phycisphaerales bacterium]|jgi:preprotein translocase subunit SecA|nr:preprotein translocase subunit SecA [Phycisphaerales bacterium]